MAEIWKIGIVKDTSVPMLGLHGLQAFRGLPEKTVESIGPAAGDEIFACFCFQGDVRGIFESKRGLYDRANWPIDD